MVELLTSLPNIPSLADSYPKFIPFQREKPHERYPILKDPVLVRATQLAVLEIKNDPKSKENVEFVVQMFSSIQSIFRKLLQERISSSHPSTVSEE